MNVLQSFNGRTRKSQETDYKVLLNYEMKDNDTNKNKRETREK